MRIADAGLARLRRAGIVAAPVPGKSEMEKINPFVGLFVAIAALNASMFVWLRTDIAEIREDVAGNSERLARIEAGLAELHDGLSAANERMARIESTVAGALERPFPERMARAPDGEDAPGG